MRLSSTGKVMLRGAKLAVSITLWFISSIIVAPVYLIIVAESVKIPKSSSVFELWAYGGAITWFFIVYVWYHIRREKKQLKKFELDSIQPQ